MSKWIPKDLYLTVPCSHNTGRLPNTVSGTKVTYANLQPTPESRIKLEPGKSWNNKVIRTTDKYTSKSERRISLMTDASGSKLDEMSFDTP